MALIKRPGVFAAGLVAVFVLTALAALAMLSLLPRPLGPFDYMVSGTLAAAVTIAAAFAAIAVPRSLSKSRRQMAADERR